LKPALFEYVRPGSVEEAVAALVQGGMTAKPIAGGQSLGPMLNLRLARPAILVDVGNIPALRVIENRGDRLRVGAAVTHAEIEDGFLEEGAGGLMQTVAGSIAYRSVRNRGTIGGSLAHADPAADWLLALTALNASVQIAGRGKSRTLPVTDLMLAAFITVLAEDEVIVAIEFAKPSANARQIHRKFCRKVGKFADAATAIVVDPARGTARVAISRPDGAPLVLSALERLLLASPRAPVPDEAIFAALDEVSGPSDDYERHLQATNLIRALAQQ
jgi:carbon-monoxide dehydrogenase medium subunit